MHARRIRTIVQLPERERLFVLAEGLERLAENVAILEADARALDSSGRSRGTAVLRSFAEEEAAKALILIDLVRAGWKDQTTVKAGLRRFYDHLARGLYVKAYSGAPADLAEVRRHVDLWRREFYLDGPMDVDWIFGNEVLASREQRLYVDYIEDEHGERDWISPTGRAFDSPYSSPAPVSTVNNPHWSDLRSLNDAVIERLEANGYQYGTDEDLSAVHYVLERWIFPLNSLDLTIATVDIEELKNQRQLWLAREIGVLDDLERDYGPYW